MMPNLDSEHEFTPGEGIEGEGQRICSVGICAVGGDNNFVESVNNFAVENCNHCDDQAQ